MEIQEKLDGLKFLSQTHRDILHKRREFEWKILFTILTFFALSSAAIITQKTDSISFSRLFVFSCFVMFAVTTIVFLAYIHHANLKNKSISENAESAIQDLINGKDITINLYADKYKLFSWESLFKTSCGGGWTWFWESLIILFFSIFASFIICGIC